MSIRNIKITVKMALFSLIMILLLITVWLLSVFQNSRISIGSSLYNEIILSNDLTADILPPPEYILESYSTALEYISADPGSRQQLYTYFKGLEKTYDSRYAYWQKTLPKDNSGLRKVFLTDAHDSAEKFYNIFDTEVVPAVQSGDSVKIRQVQADLTAEYQKHRATINQTEALSETWRKTVAAKAASMEDSNSRIMIGLIAAAILVSAAICYLLSRSLVRSVKYVDGVLGQIADGDFSASVDEKQITRDEIGHLCRSTRTTAARLGSYASYITEITEVLGGMARGDMRIRLQYDYDGEFSRIKDALLEISDSLNGMIRSIADSSNRVKVSSEQLSSGSQTLSEGATEQAGELEVLTGTLSHFAEDVDENASQVRQAKEQVESTVSGVKDSNESMRELIRSMDDISRSSAEIGKIISTVDDIAFQTNILALNASVEAARAGSAGRGFTVVAQEVRNLAAKSADAAKQTSSLIGRSIEASKSASAVARSAAEALQDVVEKAETIQQIMDHIDHVSSEQAEAIQAIRANLGQISTVVQTNSATAEESAAASRELFKQSDKLYAEVSKFQLDE